MKLENGNLVIRKAITSDAPILCKWWNDGKIMAHAGFPNGLGTITKEIITKLKNDDICNRRLILEINHIPVGEMSYSTKAEKTAGIGIKICDSNFQGKGYGSKFIKMLISYIFEFLKYNKIILDTNLNNKRAQHVYEKIGFKETGRRINSWTNQVGEIQSAIDYELTKIEYATFKDYKKINNEVL